MPLMDKKELDTLINDREVEAQQKRNKAKHLIHNIKMELTGHQKTLKAEQRLLDNYNNKVDSHKENGNKEFKNYIEKHIKALNKNINSIKKKIKGLEDSIEIADEKIGQYSDLTYRLDNEEITLQEGLEEVERIHNLDSRD